MTFTSRFLAVAGAAAILFSATAQAQPNFGPQPLELVEVAHDLYMIRNDQSGNVTVLVSDSGVLLIDDKFEFDHENIMEKVREITDQPVEYVINTHFHQDHSGGNARLQARDAVVFASENARRKMVEDERDAGLPNVTLRDHLRIHVGDEPVDIHYFGRAHTDGDVVVHLPERKTVVMGDIFAQPGIQLIHYAAGGSAREWPQTISRVLSLPFETVIPGHGELTDRAALLDYREETIRLRETVRALNAQDRSRDEIEAVLRNEFGWSDFLLNLGLDGIIEEMQ